MEKLLMCRICLAENVRMHVVVNKNLHELYERLTDIPFVTGDSRPVLACFVCCAKLKQCFQLLRKCLSAEELFAQIMNGNYEPKPLINQNHLEVAHGFIISPIMSLSIGEVGQTESIVVKEELPAVCESQDDILEPKEEYQSDDLELGNLDNSRLDVKDIVPHDSESDSEDDVPLLEFKIEKEEEQETSKEKPGAVETSSAPDARKPELEDTITTEQKKIDLSDSIIIQKTEKPFTEIKSRAHNCINNTAIDTDCIINSNTDLKQNKWQNKGIDDINRDERLTVEENSFKCKICHRIFKTNYLLNRHIRIHTGEKPFKCNICQCSFSYKHQLSGHVIKHTGEKPFNCDICQRSFSNKHHLSAHVRIHTGEKPFKCDVCHSSFRQKHCLTKHVRIHTGEKPFKCDICHSSFRQKYVLTKHIQKHSGEKPYKCDICQLSFRQKYVLINHFRVHSGEKPYKCEICQSNFKHKTNLTIHIRLHSGENPYNCDICQRSFNYKHHLSEHVRIHTGEKPYKCDVCQRAFTHLSSLKKHAGRMHPSE